MSNWWETDPNYPHEYICNECGEDFACKDETDHCARCSSSDITKDNRGHCLDIYFS
jgi:hypothetical protein